MTVMDTTLGPPVVTVYVCDTCERTAGAPRATRHANHSGKPCAGTFQPVTYVKASR